MLDFQPQFDKKQKVLWNGSCLWLLRPQELHTKDRERSGKWGWCMRLPTISEGGRIGGMGEKEKQSLELNPPGLKWRFLYLFKWCFLSLAMSLGNFFLTFPCLYLKKKIRSLLYTGKGLNELTYTWPSSLMSVHYRCSKMLLGYLCSGCSEFPEFMWLMAMCCPLLCRTDDFIECMGLSAFSTGCWPFLVLPTYWVAMSGK